MAQTMLKEGRKDVLMVDPRNIEFEKDFNVRKNYGDLQQLKDSIRENGGIRVPVRGHRKRDASNKLVKERYVITDGHRRTMAAQELAAEGHVFPVPFALEPQAYSEDKRILDMVIMNDGKSLDPIEESEVYARLVRMGWTEKQIVQHTGKSAAYINNLLKLPDAPKEIQELVKKDELSATLAVQILREHKNPEEAIALIRAAQDALNEVSGIRGRKTGGKRITQKVVDKAKEKTAVKPLNSIAELKQFMGGIDPDLIATDKVEVYELLKSIANNEAKVKDFKKYFKL